MQMDINSRCGKVLFSQTMDEKNSIFSNIDYFVILNAIRSI
jgi:hypothetical protein